MKTDVFENGIVGPGVADCLAMRLLVTGNANPPIKKIADPTEKPNLADARGHATTAADMRARIAAHFEAYSVPEYDLWTGRTATSNVACAKLWKDAWGEDWAPGYSS